MAELQRKRQHCFSIKCSSWDSNPYSTVFETVASASWATRAYVFGNDVCSPAFRLCFSADEGIRTLSDLSRWLLRPVRTANPATPACCPAPATINFRIVDILSTSISITHLLKDVKWGLETFHPILFPCKIFRLWQAFLERFLGLGY